RRRMASPHRGRELDNRTSFHSPERGTSVEPGMVGASPSGSVHSITSTVRLPRESVTRTVVPFGSGVGDQAIRLSEPPRILIRTSPGPASPRVARVITPTVPIADSSRATTLPLLLLEYRKHSLVSAGGKNTFRY